MKNLIYSMIGISIAILYFLIMVIFIIFNKLDYFDIGVIFVALIVGVFLIYIILELVIKKKKFNENLVLGIVGFVSIFFIFKSSSSPLYDILKKFDVHVFDKFSVGNDIIFNLSIGILVSIIFYTLTVKVPEYRRKKIIKNNLKKEYDLFRFSVTSEFLKYCMKDNFKKLKYKDVDNIEKFRKYFDSNNESHSNFTRWDCVISELTQEDINNILVDIEILIENIDNFFSKVEINNDELYKFFRGLKADIYRARYSDLVDGNSKIILNNVWSLLSGWDRRDGYRNFDIVERIIDDV